MVNTPDILSELLAEFRPLFDRRQFRQFSRYITSSWVSPTRSVAHLNGIFMEHTNQSSLNRFLRNIPILEIFRKSVDLINRYSSDSVLVIDDTILERNGRHIDGASWIFDHTKGKSVWGMQYVTAVISGREGIFPLNLDIKTKNGLSKIAMQMAVIKRSITAGLHFGTVVFDSWYFSSRLIRFLERERKDWITEAKSNRKILVNRSWMKLRDYAASLSLRNMTAYSIDDSTYFMTSITAEMKNAGKVQVIVSIGKNSEKFFVTISVERKPKKVIELYLRRWDVEVFHREVKQDGLRHLYQRTHESLLGTAKLSPLGELLLEISAIRSMETHLKIGKGTPDLRFRSMALGILVDLFRAMEKGGKEFLEALLASMGKPYRSTMGLMGGQIAKL